MNVIYFFIYIAPAVFFGLFGTYRLFHVLPMLLDTVGNVSLGMFGLEVFFLLPDFAMVLLAWFLMRTGIRKIYPQRTTSLLKDISSENQL